MARVTDCARNDLKCVEELLKQTSNQTKLEEEQSDCSTPFVTIVTVCLPSVLITIRTVFVELQSPIRWTHVHIRLQPKHFQRETVTKS